MRNIVAEIHKDEWIQTLTERERYAWIMLINNIADDQGRLKLNLRRMRYEIFCGDNENLISDSEIKTILANFVRNGKLIEYSESSAIYYQITNWWKYQYKSLFMARSDYPEPTGWRDAWRFNASEKSGPVQSDNWLCRKSSAGLIDLKTTLNSLHQYVDV